MKRQHIYLPEATLKAIKAKAKKEGISVSELIRRVMQNSLK